MSRKPGWCVFLTLAVLAMMWPALRAGVNTWSCIGPPGGTVSEFAVDPLHSGRVFVIADGGILHRTTDSGSHWIAVPYSFGGTRSIAVHPQNPNLILVGGQVVFRSTDGGGSWVEAGGTGYLDVVDIVFAPGSPDTVYIATTSKGVMKSTDAGQTWASRSSGLPSTGAKSLAVAGDGTVVYVSLGPSVYLSTNGGGSWGERMNGIAHSANYISTLAVDPTDGQTAYAAVRFEGLYKTTNGGGVWAKASTDPQVSSLVQDLKISPTNSQILYAAASWTDNAVVKSTNGGVNWTTLKEGLSDNEVISVGLDPQNSQVLYAGGKWSGAFRSTDGGQHWISVKSGLNNQTVDAFLQEPSDPHFLYAAVRGDGIYRSSDAGTSWEQANTGMPKTTILSLAWLPGAPASLFAAGEGVYRSTDRGGTWVARQSGLENQTINCLVVDPTSDVGTLFAGTQSGKVFKTIDAGVHWNLASTGLPSAEIRDLVADPHEPGRVFAVTDYAGTFRSLNRGESWVKLTLAPEDGEKLVADAVRKGCLYIRANNRVLRSINAGDNWVSVSSGLSDSTGRGIAADLSRSGTLYTAEFWGVYRTANSGDQWSRFSEGLVSASSIVDLYSNGAASPTVYATTNVGSVYAITLDYSNVFYFPQVGDGASGPVSVKTSLILVNTGDRGDVRFEFFDSTAKAMTLSLGSQGTGQAFAMSLGRGEAVSLQTPGAGGLKVGYAQVSTGSSIGGTAVFTYTDQAVIQYESGVPGVKPLTAFSLFMDSSGTSRETGLALVNAGSAQAAATLRLYNTSFQPIANRTMAALLGAPFGAGNHHACYAPEIFAEVNNPGLQQGVITVQSDQPLAAVTLRQNNDPALSFPQDIVTMSTFPVIAGRADGPASPATNTVLYFPQMADGQLGTTRFHTTLVLVNTRSAASSAQIEFFGSDASRMNVRLGTLGTNHTFGIPLAPGQAVSLETAGSGALQAGYVKVTTDSGVGGIIVFTLEQDGLTLYDAGVPASLPQKNMTFFMDASGGNYDTGFALVNTAGSPARVTLRLYDTSFNLLQTADLKTVLGGSDLGPGQHVARYATEVFPLIRSQNLQHGVITIESSQSLAAITLRQQDKPGVGLPGDVYLVTAFPVIPGRAQ